MRWEACQTHQPVLFLQLTCVVEGVEGGSGLIDIASAQSGEGAGVQQGSG